MPDEKISQLPPVTTVVASDLAVAVASGTTSRLTQQQLINALVSFITANVNIGGGAITLSINGTAFFGNGNLEVTTTGTIGDPTARWGINPDGSGQFASNAINWDITGALTVPNVTTAGASIQADGSASFANGAVTISATGVVSGVFAAPGAVNPNGNVTAAPGATYFNNANATFWVHNDTAVSSTGWVQLI
jgi:hypothetical protein